MVLNPLFAIKEDQRTGNCQVCDKRLEHTIYKINVPVPLFPIEFEVECDTSRTV